MTNLQPAPAGTDYPGKTLGIVGLILAIVAGGVIGLIVSAIALNQSKQAGFQNTPAKIGVILGIVVIALYVLLFIFIFALAGLSAVNN
ncbi:MAG: hypothetical protein J0H23_06430 [Micrococcales bacterium]|nr:hypothetical protein [Micrococcales bacterium]OJX67672.1 MAG: hypothetical protein BGO94_02310 [Micrococcales bacterium 72-143]